MNRLFTAFFAIACLFAAPISHAETPETERPGKPRLPGDLTALFDGYDGCFVIKRIGASGTDVFNEENCRRRVRPCSTFKILHALIGLETGILSGPGHVQPWDGTKQPVKAWERDHTLAGAIRFSVVPYFQKVARKIGAERMNHYLSAAGYGNATVGPVIDRFWLDGPLEISAFEQTDFLERLFTNRLPFQPRHMKTARQLIVLETSGDTVLSGKTGSAFDGGKWPLSWFVGHVRKGETEDVLALRIEARKKKTSGREAQRIAVETLKRMELWP